MWTACERSLFGDFVSQLVVVLGGARIVCLMCLEMCARGLGSCFRGGASPCLGPLTGLQYNGMCMYV